MTRREFVKGSVMLGAGALLHVNGLGADGAESKCIRKYHICLSHGGLTAHPALLSTIRRAGVNDVWLAGWLNGHWDCPIEQLRVYKEQVESLGMAFHVINVPLGHPSPFPVDGTVAGNAPSPGWKPAVLSDGRRFYGTSIHPPIAEDNCDAARLLRPVGHKMLFLDDDFRLARSPADIGGCFCDEHRQEFLRIWGYSDAQWQELLDDVEKRRLTPVLRSWVDYNCDILSDAFRSIQAAAGPGTKLGIMVMVMGMEKAGIRLADYRHFPFRVGEAMFNDRDFAAVKSKTLELFSSLFHRRFAQPHLAYSETTAAPPDSLSAKNLAAKLCVSTLSDVRNTMFMSGLLPFPLDRWPVLAPAMKKNAKIHERIVGHRQRGPFKHFLGDAHRYVGDHKAYSLFLAAGVPFEVTERPSSSGWTFLSDFDAESVRSGRLKSPGTVFVHRGPGGLKLPNGLTVKEDMEDLFALKRRTVSQLEGTPYIEEDVPAVCAWYPSARSVVVWNLTEETQKLTLRDGAARRSLSIGPLDIELLEDLNCPAPGR